MRFIRALRALARVELRQFRRHPTRSFLVLLLVAVPVAAVVGGATLAAITEPTAEEQAARVMGRAAFRVEAPADYAEYETLLGLLPPGTRVERLFLGAEKVAVPGRRLDAMLVALDPSALDHSGLAQGLLHLQSGRAPRHSGEVALAPILLEGLGRKVGETVTLSFGAARTITGVVLDPENLDQPVVLRTPAAVEWRVTKALFVTLSAGNADTLAGALSAAGYTVSTRADTKGGGGLAALIFAFGVIGFFEAALVIAAAFAVSLRRRQYEIGLLGSTGASMSGIAGSLLVSAAALAAAGGVAGAALGALGAAMAAPHLDSWNRRLNGGFEIHPEHLAGAILLGVVAAVLAAALPAWRAARLPIREALGGQRPLTTRSTIWLKFGLASLLLGLGLLIAAPRGDALTATLGVIGGPILGITGFGLCSPWLLDRLARRAARLPLALRLAVRDAGRFRARNGPVVTAVLAGMSMSVAMAMLSASLESAIDTFPSAWRNDQLLVEGPGAADVARQVREELPAIAVAPLAAVYRAGQPVRARSGAEARRFTREWVATGGEDLLRVLNIESAAPAFHAGRLLVLDPPDGAPDVTLTTWLDGRKVERPPFDRVPLDQKVSEPLFVLNQAVLEGLGLEAGPPLSQSLIPWLVRLDTPVTPELLERAQNIAARAAGATIDAASLHQRPARAAYRALLLVCLLTGLIVVLVATALSAAESASDERVLLSIGASPTLIRGHAAARAGYLAFLGCLLAVPAGLISAVALVNAANFPLPLVLPWRDLVITLFGLPAIAWTAMWLFGGGGAGRRAGRLIVIFLLWVTPAVPAFPAESPVPEIRWEPYAGKAFDGSPLAGELGRIQVPERRGRSDGPRIELAFVRYRTTHPNPGPPIVFLAGGPGASGVDLCGAYATHPRLRLLEQRDVIGLDQRGTGLSPPNLTGEPRFIHELPRDRAIDRADVVVALEEATTRCVAWWTKQGVDLEAYNSVESADDIEDLRSALGVDHIMTMGTSYGSHLAIAHLRRHASHVERAILLKVEGPDQTWKLPGTVQRHLVMLHDRVARDPHWSLEIPDLLGRVSEMIETLTVAPVAVTLSAGTAGGTRVVVGAYDLKCALAHRLATSTGAARIPGMLRRLSKGDWTELAEFALENRRVEAIAMPILMDCASGATTDRRRQIDRERRDPANLLGDALTSPMYPEACRACGEPDLGDAFRGPLRCDVPVLFVSGTLDARTPPENVEEILAGFTNHAHLVVENTGHDSRELMSEEYRDLLQAFIRGEAVAGDTIRLPPVRFNDTLP